MVFNDIDRESINVTSPSLKLAVSPKSLKRFDFMDPDFGLKTSLRMASNKNQRNKCRINTEIGSEIPELGLDTGRAQLDCDLNPARVANAAARLARNYSQMRAQRSRTNRQRNQPYRSSDSRLKRKRTRINIETGYENSRGTNFGAHHDGAPHSGRRPAASSNGGDDDEDADDDDD